MKDRRFVTITINTEKTTIPDGSTIADLLSELGLTGSPCAVEVNRMLVPKRRHEETPLREGDTVEIVTLVGGG